MMKKAPSYDTFIGSNNFIYKKAELLIKSPNKFYNRPKKTADQLNNKYAKSFEKINHK